MNPVGVTAVDLLTDLSVVFSAGMRGGLQENEQGPEVFPDPKEKSFRT